MFLLINMKISTWILLFSKEYAESLSEGMDGYLGDLFGI